MGWLAEEMLQEMEKPPVTQHHRRFSLLFGIK
nr:MAG TPA: hypothetical protein [Caudoviricetes sp.]